MLEGGRKKKRGSRGGDRGEVRRRGGGGEKGRGGQRREGELEVRRLRECMHASCSKLTPVLLPSPLGFHGHLSVFTYQHCLHI